MFLSGGRVIVISRVGNINVTYIFILKLNMLIRLLHDFDVIFANCVSFFNYTYDVKAL